MMETLFNGFTLDIPPGTFPLSTDSMALAHFARLPRRSSVLALGSGCAARGLLLCAKDPGCQVTGVELDSAAHAAALDNIRRNGLEARLSSICADLRQVPSLFSPGSFRCCISNPPYFSGGPAAALTGARREDHCTLEDLFASAAWALQYGGDFFLVHRPERLAEVCACASRHGLEPKRLTLLRHKTDGPVSLILLSCRKGGKPGLVWEEQSLYTSEGAQTPYFKEVYSL